MPSKLLKQKQISPPSQVTQRVEMTKTETSLFIGPLPTPDALEKYEQIQPGIAERILQMAEKEQAERHLQQKQVLDMERRNLRSLNWNIIRAQIFALLSVFQGFAHILPFWEALRWLVIQRNGLLQVWLPSSSRVAWCKKGKPKNNCSFK